MIVLWALGESISITSIIAYLLDVEGLKFLSQYLSCWFSAIPDLGSLWFTTVIMLCYLLVPLLQRIVSRTDDLKLFVILLSTAGIVVSALLFNFLVLAYFLLFAVGYCLGKLQFLTKITAPVMIVISFLFLMSLLGRFLLQKSFDDSDLYYQYVFFSHSIVGGEFIVLVAFINKRFPTIIAKITELGIIKKIENYSFFVYIVHYCFCNGRLNVYNSYPVYVATVLFVLYTFIASVVLKHIAELVQKPLLKCLNITR